ncbi:MAG: sulfur carrier protein ThiS [Frankiaceae bacterium]|nr:sulfur carrier protein ThiS [Frankiaceae bacterium]
MTVYINGEACELAARTTVAELAAARGADRRGCAVAVDGAVVPRGQWDQARLSDGQRIEIVRAVQGG